MKNSIIRGALCGASLIVPALSASFVLAPQAAAQSTTCSVTGATATDQLIECVDGSTITATGTADPAVSVTAGPGLVATSTGNQSITLSGPGSISTTGADAAQLVSGGDINFDAAQTDFAITGDGLWGTLFWANGPTGNITVTLGNVASHGLNTWGVSAFGPGDLILVTGDVVTTGGNQSVGIEAYTDGSQNITCGDVNTTGDAIIAVAGGSVTINCGSVTAPGYAGIRVVADEFASVTAGTISTSGFRNAAAWIAANGNVTVDVGNITTSGDFADGIQIVGSDVDARFADITTDGSMAFGLNILASGTANFSALPGSTITANGAGSYGVYVEAATASGTVGNVTAADADAILINTSGDASLTTAGNVSSATGSGVVINAGGTASVTVGAGTTVEGATNGVQLNGSVGNVLTVNGTLLSSTSGNAAYTVSGGPLTLTIGPGGSISMMSLSAGTTSGSTGTIIGGLAFTADNDTFNNGGIYSALETTDFGGGTDVFNNLAGGRLRASGATALASLESFSNSGAIDLQNGAAGDSLTISGDFSGSGGSSLLLDASAEMADRLAVGGQATGTTLIYVQGIKTATAAPILLVSTGLSTADAFVLGDTFATRLIELRLAQVGSDYFLTAAPNQLALQPRRIGRVAKDSWYQSTELLSTSDRQRAGTALKQGRLSFWSRLSGSNGRELQPAVASGISAGFWEGSRSGQVGIDFQPAGRNLLLGIAGGWQSVGAVSSDGGVRMTGQNVGVYGQYRADSGFYAGAVLTTKR